MNFSPGTIIGGKYRLERQLARGGMGSIWIAEDETLRRQVAVKFMDPALAAEPEARARFLREAQAAAQLKTPHVVQVFDHGIDGDTPFIAMELLEGMDLGKRLKQKRKLSLPEAASIANQIAKALRRAHEAGIVHRDLKPQNVFLARADDDDEVLKVLDFGVAKALHRREDQTTRSGSVVGSPAYMAPEQARGLKSVDHRADLWSFGVILFRAVTGVQPFTGESEGDLIYKICTEPVPVASQINPDLPTAIDAFFAQALAQAPEARFPSALKMAAAFAEVAGVTFDGRKSLTTLTRSPDVDVPSAAPSGRSMPAAPGMGTLSSVSSAAPPAFRGFRTRPKPVVIAVGALSVLAIAGAAVVALTSSETKGGDARSAKTLAFSAPMTSAEPPRVEPTEPAPTPSATASTPSSAEPSTRASATRPTPARGKKKPVWGY